MRPWNYTLTVEDDIISTGQIRDLSDLENHLESLGVKIDWREDILSSYRQPYRITVPILNQESKRGTCVVTR